MKDGRITHQLVPKERGFYQLVVEEHRAFHRKKNPVLFLKIDDGGWGCTECSDDDEKEVRLGVINTDKNNVGKEKAGFRNDFELEEVVVTRKRERKTEYPYYQDPYKSFHKYDNSNSNYNEYDNEDLGIAITGGENNSPKSEEKIKDTLTNPCALAVLDEIRITLNDDIAHLIRDVFGSSEDFNIIVYNKPFAGTEHEKETAYSKTPSASKYHLKGEIYLSDEMLATATKEYILATLYHEMLHIYLNSQKQLLGEAEFYRQYPSVKKKYLSIGNGQQFKVYDFIQTDNHDRFVTFVEKLAQTITNYNPNIPLATARAMAKVGIVEESSLSNDEKLLDQGQRLGTDKTGNSCKPKP